MRVRRGIGCSRALGDRSAVARHFVALSTNAKAVADFGIDTENMFEFWDWVGGRYSLWSAIGLSIACVIGMDQLRGAARPAPTKPTSTSARRLSRQNVPALMALLGIWYANFWGAADPRDPAVRPVPLALRRLLPARRHGEQRQERRSRWPADHRLHHRPGDLGRAGNERATRVLPADPPGHAAHPLRLHRAARRRTTRSGDHHRILLANFFAQTEALMRGKTADRSASSSSSTRGSTRRGSPRSCRTRVFAGNRPTNSFLVQKLTPRALGKLIALYEHKIFVQGVIWNVNSFDQWGVELGKQLANAILPELEGDAPVTTHDSSTNGLINHYKARRPTTAESTLLEWPYRGGRLGPGPQPTTGRRRPARLWHVRCNREMLAG